MWTDSKTKTFIVGVLRAGARRWPPKYETLKGAFTGKKKNEKTGRIAAHYLCNKCKNEFPSSQVQVDHIDPVIDPAVGFVNWDTFIERLFCGEENLQVLCSECHNQKTQEERKISANSKKANKRQ